MIKEPPPEEEPATPARLESRSLNLHGTVERERR